MLRTARVPVLSAWQPVEVPSILRNALAPGTTAYQRTVADGHLSVLVSREPEGWHMSISHRTNGAKPKPGRYPTWDEIADARYKFVPDEVTMALLLPPRGEYVNVHATTFHMHQVEGDFE